MNENAIEIYISDHSTPEDELLHDLERQTNLRVVQPRMISGHVQGKMLEILTKMFAPQYILEIGTFTGYSALCFAKGLPGNGEIHTFEIDDELEEIAAEFFEKSENSHKIHQHIGSALDLVPRLGKKFDLIFIDGDKREYPAYYEMVMNSGIARSGTIILADNVLWYGKVLEEAPKNDLFTKGIIDFNDMVQADPRVENVIIPIRDGMTLIRLK